MTRGWLVTLFALSACAHGPAGGRSGRDTPLMTVTASKGSYRMGEPVVLTVALANGSSEPLWINGRLELGQPRSGGGEIWFDVRDDKRSIPFVGNLDAAPAPVSAYRLLAPDDVVARNIVLDPFFELDSPGTLTIVAHYHDANPQRPPAPPGSRPAIEATALPVTISIHR
jgi:hypothetical protein